MIMDNEIPELLPLDGLRVKLQYRGVPKLCTGCYGKHLRRDCKEPKILWRDYIENFMAANPEIPIDFYGQSVKRVQKPNKTSRPLPKEFGLPKSEEEFNQMMEKMIECGFTKSKATEIMEERKAKYTKAKKEFEDQANNTE